MLDKFRETAITWDKANRKIYEPLRASAGDNKGRKLSVQIVNNGVVENLSGASLSLFWETKDKAHNGLDAFETVDAAKGEFEIYYKTGMLSNEGALNANLVLVDASGRIVSEPFTITVFKGIDDDAIQSSDSFTALTQALAQVGTINNKADRAELLALESTFEQNKVSVDQQLQQTNHLKLDRNENESIGLAMFKPEVLNALNDGEVTVNVNTSMIENGAVTPEKVKIDEFEAGTLTVAPFENVEWVNREVNIVNGSMLEVPTNDRITSELIQAVYLEFTPSLGNGRFSVFQYNLEGQFVKQAFSGQRVETLALPEGYLYRVLYAFDPPSTLNPNVVGRDVQLFYKANPIKIQKKSIGFDELKKEVTNRIEQSINGGLNPKFMHISADDVLDVFQDIQTNSRGSIFDNSVLSFLKNMNDEYGMVFSMYCWFSNSTETYDLSMFPSAYASEFRENAHWLKFGAHFLRKNYGSFGDINANEGIQGYKDIMENLFRITGGSESLDFVPRLHNYAGSNDFISGVTSINLGLKGLLTSEDIRANYNLTTEQNDYMQIHDRMTIGNLILFSTDLRLENVSDVTSSLSNIVTNVDHASRSNDLILFTHEPDLSGQMMKNKIREACEFAINNGYSFDFPQNRI